MRYSVDPNTGELTLLKDVMVGATATQNGRMGYAPEPKAGEQNHYLSGGGIYKPLPVFRGVSGSIQSIPGMVPQAQVGDENKAFFGDGTFKTVETEDTNFEGTLDDWNNLTPEQQAKYKTRDLRGDFNGMPIDEDLDSSSNHPVENQAIAKNIEAIVNTYGSKNLLPNTATTQVVNAVTFIVNSDGSVTVDGTASANWTSITLATFVLPAGSYRATGIYNPSVWYNDVRMSIHSADDGGATINQILSVYDEYLDFTLNQPTNLLINLTVRNKNDTVSNATFYPMIRDARISDDTYVPYAMTNTELTKVVKDQIVYETNDYSSIAITTQSYSGAYYSSTYDVSKTGYKPIAATIVTWSGTAASFVPYINSSDKLGFISDISQTVGSATITIIYKKK